MSASPDEKLFTVEMTITRHVTVVIPATDMLKAREKANNLDFKHELIGEIAHWEVKRVSEAPDSD